MLQVPLGHFCRLSRVTLAAADGGRRCRRGAAAGQVHEAQHVCSACTAHAHRQGSLVQSSCHGHARALVALLCQQVLRPATLRLQLRSLYKSTSHVACHLCMLHAPHHFCHVIRHTSYVTRHTSLITRATSHVTRHTSHIICNTLQVTRHTSHVTRHTSHVTRHTSCVTRYTSHVTCHTSHVTRHTSHESVATAAGARQLFNVAGHTPSLLASDLQPLPHLTLRSARTLRLVLRPPCRPHSARHGAPASHIYTVSAGAHQTQVCALSSLRCAVTCGDALSLAARNCIPYVTGDPPTALAAFHQR